MHSKLSLHQYPSKPKSRSAPSSNTSFAPLSRHEKKELWKRQMGIHDSSPLKVAKTGKVGKETSGRKYVSILSKNKGKPPPKVYHRNTSYTRDTTPVSNDKKQRYRLKYIPFLTGSQIYMGRTTISGRHSSRTQSIGGCGGYNGH